MPLLNLDLKQNNIAKIILLLKNSWVFNVEKLAEVCKEFSQLTFHGTCWCMKFFRNPWFTQIHRWEGSMFTHLWVLMLISCVGIPVTTLAGGHGNWVHQEKLLFEWVLNISVYIAFHIKGKKGEEKYFFFNKHLLWGFTICSFVEVVLCCCFAC